MGLWDWTKNEFYKLTTGVDLQAETARSNADDATRAAQDQDALDSGLWTAQDMQVVSVNRAAEQQSSTYTTSVDQAFVQGAKDGLAAEQSAVKSAVTSVTGGILGFIPWWLWIVLAVAIYVYFGAPSIKKRVLW